MKNIFNIMAGVVIVATMSSCAVTMPVAISDAPIGGKRGVSESNVLFGIIYMNGNYGIKEAAKNGKITGGIGAIDEKTTNYLIFAKKELIVLGQ